MKSDYHQSSLPGIDPPFLQVFLPPGTAFHPPVLALHVALTSLRLSRLLECMLLVPPTLAEVHRGLALRKRLRRLLFLHWNHRRLLRSGVGQLTRTLKAKIPIFAISQKLRIFRANGYARSLRNPKSRKMVYFKKKRRKKF